MAIASRELSGNNPVITVNLEETFGQTVNDENIAQAFLGDVIEEIRTNTQGGNSRTGDPFKEYSKSYVDSFVFKVFGKSEDEVNLTQTGDMLGTMDIIELDLSTQTAKIGWTDPEQAAKAHGHITGKNGEVPKMKRDFFGLPSDRIKSIAEKYKESLVNEELQEAVEESSLARALRFLLGSEDDNG